MSTQEIPRDEWVSFLDRFSKQHEGWLVTLEVFAPDIGAQQEATEIPLEGISLASSSSDPETIAISVGKERRPYCAFVQLCRQRWSMAQSRSEDPLMTRIGINGHNVNAQQH